MTACDLPAMGRAADRPTGRLRRWAPGQPNQRGSTSVEVVVLAPVLLLLVAVMVYGGRVTISSQSLQQATDDAAREASLARTPYEARADAISAARASLDEQGVDCRDVTVDVDAAEFARPVGTVASVRVTVTCSVRLSDLAVPGAPGSKTLTAHATSPLDTYRRRS